MYKMRNMPRILLLLFICCSMTMLFVTKCGMNMAVDQTINSLEVNSPQKMVDSTEYISEIMREKDQQHQTELQKLMDKISVLEQALTAAKVEINKTVRPGSTAEKKAQFFEDFFQNKIEGSELMKGLPYNNEYEMFPFQRFTINKIFLTEPGLGKRVVEKPIGLKKRDLLDVVTTATGKLNEGRRGLSKKYKNEDFLEGIYRNEPGIGTHYELTYKDIDQYPDNKRYRKITISRPYGPMHFIGSVDKSTTQDKINLVLPLSGRIGTFQKFMDRFHRICIKRDGNVYLTIVYFGTEGLKEVKNIIGAMSKRYKFKNIKLITLNETFSRGRGLQVGAQSWKNEDVILFLCDVDVVFTPDYLERCRLNTEKGKRVYYPIVFSLYNPKLVYNLQDIHAPPEHEQLIISKETGFWRDFGYGMTCQYRSDFLDIGGFDEEITGWGTEDVYLYRKYVKSNFMVVRATDPGLFHLWHEKHCDSGLPPDQYRSCIGSKSFTEGSHSQLGLLAFRDEIDIHKKSFVLKQKVVKIR